VFCQLKEQVRQMMAEFGPTLIKGIKALDSGTILAERRIVPNNFIRIIRNSEYHPKLRSDDFEPKKLFLDKSMTASRLTNVLPCHSSYIYAN
jgi:hypothetical protein